MIHDDIRAVRDYLDGQCTGTLDCKAPHQAFERIVSRILPAATPDDTDTLERARLAQGAEGGDD